MATNSMVQQVLPVTLLVLAFLWAYLSNQLRDLLDMLVLAPHMSILMWLLSMIFANKVVRIYVLAIAGFLGTLKLLGSYENELVEYTAFFYNYICNILMELVHILAALEISDEVITLKDAIIYITTEPIHLVTVTFANALSKSNTFWVLLVNQASCFGDWFRETMHEIIKLVSNYFPGGILGIGVVVITIIAIECAMFLRWVQRLSRAYKSSVQIQRTLHLELEGMRLKLDLETKEVEQEEQKAQQLKLDLDEERDKRLCGICQDEIKTILLLPCRHMCLCKGCLGRKKWKKCPICRQGVQSTMKVYV